MILRQLVPRVYETESIYSISARLLFNDISTSVSQAMLNIFDNRNIQLDAALPSYLQRLAKFTMLSVENLISHHSIVPYLARFANEGSVAKGMQFLKEGDSSAAFKALGLLASRLPEETQLKYCPICAEAQKLAFGETYWLREHQLPLVSVCLTHHCKLKELPRKRKHLLFPLSGQMAKPSHSTVAFRIAEFSKWVLDGPALDAAQLRRCYAARLLHKGFASTKAFKLKKWTDAMTQFYAEYLDDPRLTLLFTNSNEHGYPANIFYSDTANHHPLKHILILAFLFEHVGDFVVAYSNAGNLCKPIQDQPQPLLQEEIDKQRRNKVISALRSGKSLKQTTRTAGVASATVRNIAAEVGFQLDRRVRKLNTAQLRAITIKLVVGLPTETISKQLKVTKSDVEQVLVGQKDIKILRQRIRYFKRRKQARDALVAVIEAYSGFRIKDAKEQCYADYMWLYKHDGQWLSETLLEFIVSKKDHSDT